MGPLIPLATRYNIVPPFPLYYRQGMMTSDDGDAQQQVTLHNQTICGGNLGCFSLLFFAHKTHILFNHF